MTADDEFFLISPTRQKATTIVVGGMEAVLLVLACLSPWAYGAIHPSFAFLLHVGIAALLVLWGTRMLLEGQIRWKKSPVALCLAGLFLLGLLQRTPFSRPLLARLSPATARCYDQLLPQRSEILPDGVARFRTRLDPGSTLSLYPGATQRQMARFLAVFLVFVVVYNNLVSKAALLRLSVVVLLNSVFLSFFALIQFFSAPHDTVYWTYSTLGEVFGPFLNHNHFPDYVNMGIGLGMGLLVSRRQGGSLRQALRQPLVCWICVALGLMASAVAFSLSRGGLLALVGAAAVGAILGRLQFGRSFRLGSILLVAGAAVALSACFGMGLVKERLDTLWSGKAFDNRIPLWHRSLPIVKDFPIWGTGYGTFGYVEPMYRPDAPSSIPPGWYGHAHNEYLEILVEGGVVGLGLALLTLTIVYRLGFRALKRNRGRPEGGLVMGALFAFTALVLHSFGDFGPHIPAIALLATVVCAHLCARRHGADANEYRLRLGGIAPVFGMVAALGFGLVLCAVGWKAHRLDQLEGDAVRAGNTDTRQLRARIAYYAAAVALEPDEARLHKELGFAHAQLTKQLAVGFFSNRRSIREQSTLTLREYLAARDACPLLAAADLGIAAYASRLTRGDAAEEYLRRVKRLTPGQAEMWYLCGLQELILGRREDAWATWRHCLELSDDYLPFILDRTTGLAVDKLVDKVLPDNAEVLLDAALRRYPDETVIEKRRPFLEKALRLREGETGRLGSHALHVKARIYKALDQPIRAIQTYRELVGREPSQANWRFELARYLYDLGKPQEARRELVMILAQQPNHLPTRDLLNKILQELRGKNP